MEEITVVCLILIVNVLWLVLYLHRRPAKPVSVIVPAAVSTTDKEKPLVLTQEDKLSLMAQFLILHPEVRVATDGQHTMLRQPEDLNEN